MEELLYALQPYGVGLNAARWDYQASILEYVMNDPDSVWPDRFGVDIKTSDFLGNGFRRLVAICLQRGGIPIGGMATALPSKQDEVNRQAAAAIRADKLWEAKQGFLRGWVAHIFHMKTAADPFKELHASGWEPTPEMTEISNYPVEVKVPEGPITFMGTRRNARTLLEYVEGWLRGRGAKGIDSMAAQPGDYPALMEDLATARISVAQIGQRIRHGAKDSDSGKAHDFAVVKGLLVEELESILELGKSAGVTPAQYAAAEERYRTSLKIALRWIKNYTELDFRALGTYSRPDLERIAADQDAF
jgi:malate synthase